MIRIATWLILAACLLPAIAGADQQPAQGKLLVATEQVVGELFAQTVVVLLHYDETGAMGLVVNRPTDVEPAELLADDEVMAAYRGTVFWGGPVQMNSLRVLLLTDSPPAGAINIVDSVHLLALDESLSDLRMGASHLRLFIGYAGWSAGQLDNELRRGDWRIVPASNERVFAEDPSMLWQHLTPMREYRAAVQPSDFPTVRSPSARRNRAP